MNRIFIFTLFFSWSVNYCFADFKCKAKLKEVVPVFKIDFRVIDGKKIDFTKGVPADQIIKKTEYNPQLFDGSYASLYYKSESINNVGYVVYSKAVLNNHELKIIEKCIYPNPKEEIPLCIYPISTNGSVSQNSAVMELNQSDKVFYYSQVIGSMMVIYNADNLIVTSTVNKRGIIEHIEGSNLNNNEELEAEGYSTSYFLNNPSSFKIFVYGKSSGTYDMYASLEVSCNRE